jgi:hypothetical protein
MNRIILGMAVANYGLVALTVYLGLLSDPTADPNSLGDGAFRYHFPMGLLTALFTMLVHCLVFTYFLGTNRWVKETTAAYSMGPQFPAESRRLRTKAFAMAMTSMLLVVAAVATGAGAHTKVWPLWLHQSVPVGAYVFMLWAYRVEYLAVEDHIQLTNAVMDEVNRMRRERGQPEV